MLLERRARFTYQETEGSISDLCVDLKSTYVDLTRHYPVFSSGP